MWLGNAIGIIFKKCRISIMKIDSNLGKGSQLFRCDIYLGVWKRCCGPFKPRLLAVVFDILP